MKEKKVMTLTKNSITLLLGLLLAHTGNSQETAESLKRNLQHSLNDLVASKSSHGVITHIQKADDSFVWTGTAGNFSSDTTYFISGLSQLYVAAIVLRLQSDGKLNLDDKIGKYMDKELIKGIHIFENTDYSQVITIEHLLTHTSGLPDFVTDKRTDGTRLIKSILAGKDQSWTREQMLETVKGQMKPVFPPGTSKRAHHSNVNYILLCAIIESVTKQTIKENLEFYIFTPLKLKQTYLFANSAGQRPANLFYKKKQLTIPMAITSFNAEAGIVSTAKENMVFLRAFFQGQLFDKHYVQEAEQVWNKIASTLQYGLGFAKLEASASEIGEVTPNLFGYADFSGAFSYYCSELDVYLTGTTNQINETAAVQRMVKDMVATLRASLPSDKPYYYKPGKFLSPLVGYAGETDLQLGANYTFLFKPKNNMQRDLRTSYAQVTAIYTLKNQIDVNGGFNIFSDQDRWNFTGLAQFTLFPLNYFGIGNNTQKETMELATYKAIELNTQVLRKITGRWYAGAGYRYVNNYDFENVANGLLETARPFGWQGSQSSGIQMLIRQDSRDNIINASKGYYLNVEFAPYRKSLGSSSDYEKLTIDFRNYYSLRKNDPYKSIIASQLYVESNFGTVPFTDMGYLGGVNTMRGYLLGRFIDKKYVAFQTEYRHKLNYWLGYTAFVGIGNVYSKWSDFSFSSLKLSGGMGLRINLEPKERFNLRIDMGYGENNSSNLIITFIEAF
jgi:D-alanyl-D-alanine carboxypeptidase